MPLRHGRPAHITVVVAEQFDHLELLNDAVWQHTRARIVLGPAAIQQIADVLGLPPHTTPTPHVPPGRGYARLGTGPVHRLQVPATPDPYDEATHPAYRQAVMELLPERAAPGAGSGSSGQGPARPLQGHPPAQGSALDASEVPEVPAEAP